MGLSIYEATPYKLRYTKGTFNPDATKETSYGTADYTIFGQDYFAGANVSIYFEDILVDEVVAIQFALQEQAMPIYGYGSYVFDVIAKGNRIVNGSFGIYYKEQGYLPLMMRQIEEEKAAGTVTGNPFSYSRSAYKLETPEDASIEKLLDALANKNNTKAFTDLANAYEATLWGGSASANNIAVADMYNRQVSPYFTPYSMPNLRNDGFKITFSFGPEAQRQHNKDSIPVNMEQIPTTVRTINHVHLTGSRMVISSNGEPLYEEYDFVARDFDAVGK